MPQLPPMPQFYPAPQMPCRPLPQAPCDPCGGFGPSIPKNPLCQICETLFPFMARLKQFPCVAPIIASLLGGGGALNESPLDSTKMVCNRLCNGSSIKVNSEIVETIEPEPEPTPP